MTASLILGGKRPGQGSLSQGGVGDVWPSGYRHYEVVVLTALEFQPCDADRFRMAPTEILAHPFDDCPLTNKHLREAIDLANQVALRVRQGKRVLVTCAMGWNRSGLIVALATHQLTGLSGKQIVRRIKMKRGERALGNTSFREAVERIAPSRNVPHQELSNYVSVVP